MLCVLGNFVPVVPSIHMNMATGFYALLLFLFTLHKILHYVEAGCPFQNPFWFVEKPAVASVFDENGEMVANKVRVIWGRMENFKCVDYFQVSWQKILSNFPSQFLGKLQVEYFQRLNPAQTVQLSPRINRHRRSVEIEVMPCTDYFFKVIASEDWKGLREDFKVFSEVVGYRNQYTPKFVNPPIVKERRPRDRNRDRARARARQRQRARSGRQMLDGAPVTGGSSPAPTEPAVVEQFTIKVGWRLSDIDYPVCLDYFVLDYYDTVYNETSFQRTFTRPFMKPRFELEVSNQAVPCDPDYEFNIYAFGFNKESSRSYWTPPACIVTTPAPTTITTQTTVSAGAVSTTESMSDKMEVLQAENEMLQAKIDGLKQEYEKIGLQVFLAFQDHLFGSLEDFVAQRRAGGQASGPRGNNTDPMFS